MLSGDEANEWQDVAMWCARRGYTAAQGEPLPMNLSAAVVREIAEYPEEFQAEVKAAAYALARGDA